MVMNKQDGMYVPLRERNKQRILQRIQEATFVLFRTIGYDQTTMDAIAEKAETSRGTLSTERKALKHSFLSVR
jgi:AcrR family transcriptional regulator